MHPFELSNLKSEVASLRSDLRLKGDAHTVEATERGLRRLEESLTQAVNSAAYLEERLERAERNIQNMHDVLQQLAPPDVAPLL